MLDGSRHPDRDARILGLSRTDASYNEMADVIGCSRNVIAGVIFRAHMRIKVDRRDSEIARARLAEQTLELPDGPIPPSLAARSV